MLAQASGDAIVAIGGPLLVLALSGLTAAIWRLANATTALRDVRADLAEVRATGDTTARQLVQVRIDLAVLQAQVTGRPYKAPRSLEGPETYPSGS
jgi:hypothetical protein